MNLRLIAEPVLIAGFIFCIFVPFPRKRLRARWAKLLFCGIGVVGLVYTFAEITLDKRWFALTQSHTEFLRHQLHFVRGLLLGALLSLLFSVRPSVSSAITMIPCPSNHALQPTAGRFDV